MITEDYVSYETAKLLKEKGFEGECSRFCIPNGNSMWKYEHYHNFDISDRIECPTIQMALKWLRKVHNLNIWVEPNHDKEGLYNAHVKVGWWSNNWAGVGYNTYEKATEEAIKYCLKHLIN